MKLLIVDDAKIVCERLRELISDIKDIEVVGEAYDTDDAIESINLLNPDVVILDLKMPGRGGIAVLREIKGKEHIPIIIVFTNYPFPQYKKISMELGADYFFNKSSEFEEVKKVLKRIIDEAAEADSQKSLN